MVAEHPLGSVYHHTAFGQVIAATFRHAEPHYLALLDAAGRCFGGIVLFLVRSWLTGNRLVSIPWACYGDPLVKSAGDCEVLLAEILSFARQAKASYIEIRACQSTEFLTSTKLLIPDYRDVRHFLDLTKGLDALWERLHPSCIRKMIGRAERRGFEVRAAQSAEEVASFYRVFSEHRRRLGLPPQKPEYFLNLWEHLAPHGLVQFWIAEKHKQVVGGLCSLAFKDCVSFNYIGAEESFLQSGGCQYLYWIAIRTASQQALRVIDFGRVPRYAEGLMKYKRRWGASELDAPVFYYPRIMGVSSYDHEEKLSFRAMRWFWRTSPPSLSRIAGRFFYRHTG
jgi:serine/alanine adding enzyme